MKWWEQKSGAQCGVCRCTEGACRFMSPNEASHPTDAEPAGSDDLRSPTCTRKRPINSKNENRWLFFPSLHQSGQIKTLSKSHFPPMRGFKQLQHHSFRFSLFNLFLILLLFYFYISVMSFKWEFRDPQKINSPPPSVSSNNTNCTLLLFLPSKWYPRFNFR